jgi:hypothetical protein
MAAEPNDDSESMRASMSEVIANLDYTVVDQSGREYYANVAAEPTGDGQWEAWLEFIPLDDTVPLVTDTETTQLSRSAVAHWASSLGETYVRGAFERSTLDETRRTARIASPLYDEVPLASAAVIDPFELLPLGKDVLRTQLLPLTRAELLTIIQLHNLNPARVSLARLSTSQLITFIATATEAQVIQGRQ